MPRRDSSITEGNYHRAWPIGYCTRASCRAWPMIDIEVSEAIAPSDSDENTSSAFLEHLIIEDFS